MIDVLTTRFGAMLHVVHLKDKEIRFQSGDQQRYSEIIHSLMTMLAPWSTKCLLPQHKGLVAGLLPRSLKGNRHQADRQDRVETNRIHALVHSICFAKLTNAVWLPRPDQMTDIPCFQMSNANASRGGRDDPPAALSPEELRRIKTNIAREEERGKLSSPTVLRVEVDRILQGFVTVEDSRFAEFTLNRYARRIDIYEVNSDLLVAVHFLEYDATGLKEMGAQVSIGRGRKIVFTVQQGPQDQEGILRVDYVPGTKSGLLNPRMAWALPVAAVCALLFGLFIPWHKYSLTTRLPVANVGNHRQLGRRPPTAVPIPPSVAGQESPSSPKRLEAKRHAQVLAFALTPISRSPEEDYPLYLARSDKEVLFEAPIRGVAASKYLATLKTLGGRTIEDFDARPARSLTGHKPVLAIEVPAHFLTNGKYVFALFETQARRKGQLIGAYGFRVLQAKTSGEALRPSQHVEGQIAFDRDVEYRFPISAGQYTEITIRASGTEIEAGINAPGEESSIKSAIAPGDQTIFPIVSRAAGDCVIVLHAPIRNNRGQYFLEIDKVRIASENDKMSTQASGLILAGRNISKSQAIKSQKEAIAGYEAALALAQSADDLGVRAEALQRIGEAYANLSENKKALEYFDKALPLWQQVNNSRRIAELLDYMGGSYFNLGERAKALEFLNKALHLTNDPRTGSGIRNDLGVVNAWIGEYNHSLDYLNEALLLRQTLGDLRGEAETLINLGDCYSKMGRMGAAIDELTEALPLVRSVHDRYLEAAALNDLAVANSSLGNKETALGYYNEALAVEREVGDQQGEANTLINIGNIYEDLGDAEIAYSNYMKAAPIAKRIEDTQLQLVALIHMASLTDDSGDTDTALQHYREAIALSRTVKDLRFEATALNNEARVYSRVGQRDAALALYDEALAIRQKLGNPAETALTLANIGDVNLALGANDKAEALFEQALSLCRSASNRNCEAVALLGLARANHQTGNLTVALTKIGEATDIIESLRWKVGAGELRSSYSATVRQYFDLFIDVLMDLDKNNPSAGYAAKALEVCERGRARTLLELLTENGVDIRRGVDPILLEKERLLLKQIDSYEYNKKQSPHSDTASVDLADIERQYLDVESQIRRNSPRYSELTQHESIAATRIQHELIDPETILLEYKLGRERTYLWVVTTAGIHAFELPKRDEIEKVAKQFYSAVSKYQRDPTARGQNQSPLEDQLGVARKLSTMLLGPAVSFLNSRRIVIVADGVLSIIPIAALPDPVGARDGDPLLVKHEISYSPSAAVLLFLRNSKEARSKAPKSIAVLADPVFNAGDSRLKSAQGFGTDPRPDDHPLERSIEETLGSDQPPQLYRLLFSRSEADSILSVFGRENALRAVDFDASLETATSPSLAEYRIVHFSTHGLLDPKHPMMSGLVFSLFTRDGHPRQGFLNLSKIYSLKLRADLVVLSACQTALGKYIDGEGVVSLARGFMYAGAPRVLASVWRVDDAATAELMRYFYVGMLNQHLPPAQALHMAQIKLWRQQKYSSPYFWAPFVLEGEWK
jgi:CHAT domain-containing protein/Tfp pilus assembly protein PilF